MSLGSGAMTNTIGEIENTDAMFVIGSNTTENHPVIATFMKRAKKKGAKLIVADPRRIDLANIADVYLPIKPGSNIALLNAMQHVIIKEGLQDTKYIEQRTEAFEDIIEVLEKYTPEYSAKICGVKAEDIVKAARIYAEANKAGIYYTMGITQHLTGTHNVLALSNLALLCGNVGIESGGVNPLRGQNNVQGACDMGATPADFPGYQKVIRPEVVDKFEKAWDKKLSGKVGLTLSEMLDGAYDGSIKLLYVFGENPMVSDPDLNHVKHSFEKLDFLVVQDIFMTETAELADVVLPAASFAEKDGTFSNTERKVQRVRKAVEPIEGTKPDWQIIMELSQRIGLEKKYRGPEKIMEEIASVTPSYGGITYDRIEEEGLQWPCPTADHPGTPYLHKEAIARGRGLFFPVDQQDTGETANEEYPFIMTTGRVLYHYHTRTMTGKVDGLNKKSPESFIEISAIQADKMGLSTGDKVKVTSRRGSLETKAKVTDMVEENITFMPFHFIDGAVNTLTNAERRDKYAKIPELKVLAVRIEKLGG